MIAPTRILVCVVALAVAACAPQGEPSQEEIEADIAAVTAVRDQEVAAINSGEVDISYLAADALMMPPNEPALSGSTAIGEWIRGFLSQYTATLNYTSSDITVSGDWAIERYAGTITLTPVGGGDPVEETLKGIHVYRRGDDGSWKMVYDVWNSDTPLPEM
jgi:ketosteroid isomerase-like protein